MLDLDGWAAEKTIAVYRTQLQLILRFLASQGATYVFDVTSHYMRRPMSMRRRSGRKPIIDLHDGAATENDALRLARPLPMLEALPTLIDELHARRFCLVGLDEMELVEPKVWGKP